MKFSGPRNRSTTDCISGSAASVTTLCWPCSFACAGCAPLALLAKRNLQQPLQTGEQTCIVCATLRRWHTLRPTAALRLTPYPGTRVAPLRHVAKGTNIKSAGYGDKRSVPGTSGPSRDVSISPLTELDMWNTTSRLVTWLPRVTALKTMQLWKYRLAFALCTAYVWNTEQWVVFMSPGWARALPDSLEMIRWRKHTLHNWPVARQFCSAFFVLNCSIETRRSLTIRFEFRRMQTFYFQF